MMTWRENIDREELCRKKVSSQPQKGMLTVQFKQYILCRKLEKMKAQSRALVSNLRP